MKRLFFGIFCLLLNVPVEAQWQIVIDSIRNLSPSPGQKDSVHFRILNDTGNKILPLNRQYRIELSDALGTFSKPVTVGQLQSMSDSGWIVCTIPQNRAECSVYRLRAAASNDKIDSIIFPGTLQIAPSAKVSAANYGFHLDRSNYVNCGNDSSVNLSNHLTIEAWVNQDTSDITGDIVMKGINTYGLWEIGGQPIFFRVTTGQSSWSDLSSHVKMTPGVWCHLAGTYDGNFQRIYVNGVLTDSLAFTAPLTINTDSLIIGREDRWFRGLVDEVQVWNRTLSDSEIALSMTVPVSNRAGLAAYYRFNEGDGFCTKDESPNGYLAHIIGAPEWVSGINNIAITSLSKTSLKPGDSITASFKVMTPFDSSNVFTLQLLYGEHTFNIGSLAGMSGGTVSGLIPASLPSTCSVASLRVVASSPYFTGISSNSLPIENFFKPGTDFAMKFDGNPQSYVDLGPVIDSGSFTVSMWVKPDSTNGDYATIFNIQNDLGLYQHPGVKNNYIFLHYVQADLEPNTWQHVTITFDGVTGERKAYLFGQIVDSHPYRNASTYTPGFHFYLGSGTTGIANQPWKGYMDEVKLWDHVLSDSEIQQNVNSILTGNELGLLGYWEFNEGCLPTVADKSPNHFTGTVSGSASRVESTVPAFALEGAIVPSHAGNVLQTTVKIRGASFTQKESVKLYSPTLGTISADSSLTTPDGSMIIARFTLDGAPLGLYDVMATNDSGIKAQYPHSFTIDTATPPELSVQVLGRTKTRAGGQYILQLQVQNLGNIDAIATPIFLAIPTGCSITALDPIGIVDSIYSITGQTPLVAEYDSVFDDNSSGLIASILFPRMPAGDSRVLTFLVDSVPNSNFEVAAWPTEPLIYLPSSVSYRSKKNQVTPQSFWKYVVGSCWDNYVSTGLGLVPGFGLIEGLLEVGLNTLIDEINSDDPRSIFYQKPPSSLDAFKAIATDFGMQAAQIALDAVGANLGAGVIKSIPQAWRSELKWFLNLPKNAPATTVVERLPFLNNFASIGHGAYGAIGDCFPPKPVNWHGVCSIQDLMSFDPNEKSGALQYLHSNDLLSYHIEFENVDTATAAAQTVSVIDTLDKNIVDLSTFSFTNFGLGKSTYSAGAPYQPEFLSQVDLRPATQALMQVRGRIDTSTGIIKWQFTTLDTGTREFTLNDTLGFLPPDHNPPMGQGWVGYSVKFKPNMPTGTTVDHKALVVFDYNPPITTNDWPNTIDDIPPTSAITNLPSIENDSIFPVQWSGSDSGSSVAGYKVMYAEDTGEFQPLISGTLNTVDTFHAQFGHTYRFYSVAVDQAGNVQQDSTIATTMVEPGSASNGDQLLPIYPNPTNGGASVEFFLTQNEHVSIRLFDSRGTLMKTIFDGDAVAGSNLVMLDTKGLDNELYHCEMISDKARQTQSVVVMLPEPK